MPCVQANNALAIVNHTEQTQEAAVLANFNIRHRNCGYNQSCLLLISTRDIEIMATIDLACCQFK